MGVLKIGSKGSAVKALQKDLRLYGTRPKPEITGTYDKATEQAVRSLQSDYGTVKVDGKVGPNTRRLIEAALENKKKPFKMNVPDYASLLKKRQSNFAKAKQDWLNNIIELTEWDHPVLKSFQKEYMTNFTVFCDGFTRWKTKADKIIPAQKGFTKEIGRDPWTAKELLERCRTLHAEAGYADSFEGGLILKKRLDAKFHQFKKELGK